jgi:predicted alpha/beta hydrolase family esterase
MKEDGMRGQVLFIQGAGHGAYDADQQLASSLRHALGPEYDVRYPAMPDEENAPYELWTQHIEAALTSMQGPIMLVGHSVGGSIIAKWMSDGGRAKPIAGVFLIATPFWGGDGWRYEGYEELELPNAFALTLPKGARIFLYHCRDDETVPVDHLALYARVLPQAVVRELDECGHQLNDDLSLVAEDVKGLPAEAVPP